MGNTQIRRNRSSIGSEGSTSNNRTKQPREHKRYGTVVVKVTNIAPNRRPQDNVITHSVSAKGAILFGSQSSLNTIQKALSTSGYPLLIPSEIQLPDTRAHKILVAYCKGWYAIPSPEVFSRHSGTCLILGDRNITCNPYSIKVGDCFRLGSVGLVVSEMKVPGRDEVRLDAKTLQFLKDEALAFDTQEDMATLANDELNKEEEEEELLSNAASPTKDLGGGIANGERFICYMCYETHNTDEDALVAPCECKGDTRYLHVQCLQKWYQSSVCGSQAQVIRTTGNGAPACKICGAAYKSAFRRADGKKASLLEMDSVGPYLSLVVVTRHDTNPGLFNTKFRLSFGRQANSAPTLTEEQANTLVIGRSSSCNMILDYRTVSTVHAQITYQDGSFYMTDKRSSNGTMVYLQDPIPLSYSNQLKFRMGRTTLSLQAKRGWTTTLRTALGVSGVIDEAEQPSAEDLHNVLSECRKLQSNREGDNEGNNNFMLIRQYTTRTNNDNSIDPHDVDELRESPAGLRIRNAVDVMSNDGDANVIDLIGNNGGSSSNNNGNNNNSVQRTNSEEEELLLSRMRATFVDPDDDADFNRAIHESLMLSTAAAGATTSNNSNSNGNNNSNIVSSSGAKYQQESDLETATMYDHQSSTDALYKPVEITKCNNNNNNTNVMKSPRFDSPVMLGDENGGRSLSKLGTIVLANGVENIPEKPTSSGSSREYKTAAATFAVPVQRSSNNNSNSNSVKGDCNFNKESSSGDVSEI
jgi:hypothetical protein